MRENSPAYRGLTRSMRQVLSAIERAYGDGDTATLSYSNLVDDGVPRPAIAKALRVCEALGLVDLVIGPKRVSVLSRSARWQSLDADEVARRYASAKQPRGPRLSSRPRPPPKPPRQPRVVMEEDDEPMVPRYQTPSLPMLRFMGEI